MLRPVADMAIFGRAAVLSGSTAMSLRALLYRRPTEPSAIEIIFDKSVYLVRLRRHRQALRYTLRIEAATRSASDVKGGIWNLNEDVGARASVYR